MMFRQSLGAVVGAVLIGLMSAALVAPPALAQDSADDPTVAKVNGKPILRSEVFKLASELPQEYQAQIGVIFPMLVERLVDLKLIALAAADAGLSDDAEVARRLELHREEVMRDVFIERALAKALTDEVLQARYKTYLDDNPPETEVSARHILLESEDDAKTVISDLDQGADFATLARERSTGPSSSQGGELGFFTKDQMVPEFAEAAFALDAGAYSKAPVETQFGWHVILVEERRTQAPPAFEDVEAELQSEVSRETVRDMVAEMREGAEIEMMQNPMGAPSAESGEGESEESTQQ